MSSWYRLRIRTSTSGLPFAYISDPFEMTRQAHADYLHDLTGIGHAASCSIRVDGEVVVINPRYIVSAHLSPTHPEPS